MSVREAQQRVSSREFAEWMAYYRLEPFGELRHDLQSAIIASVIANVNRNPKKHAKPFKVDEFMPDFGTPEEEEPMTPEQALEHVKRLHQMFGALEGSRVTDG